MLTQGFNNLPQQVYLDFVYQPIRNAAGEVTGIFVDGYDVTERVRNNEILREEDKRKDEFLAMLAHELRNPLAPIMNASKILTQTFLLDSQAYAIGDLITRQATHLNRLVDDLLDVSRITQGRIELQQKPLELEHVIKLALETTQPFFKEKQHEISYTGKSDLFINGDTTRMIQCLVNILNNAAKYTENKGQIDIHLYAQNDMAVIEVSDNGIGITPEVLPNVFDLFVQAHRTLDRSQGGLGIGLSIVRRLIQMHDGHVIAMSKGLGQGSTFKIYLPLIETPVNFPSAITETKPSAMRILVIDDNIDAANSLAELLQLKGHEATAAYSARDALQLAKTYSADIILLDIGLPDMDGYEIARQLRSDRHDNVLIALTGYGKSEDIRKAHDAGFNAHMTKPVAFEALERVLGEYCPR